MFVHFIKLDLILLTFNYVNYLMLLYQPWMLYSAYEVKNVGISSVSVSRRRRSSVLINFQMNNYWLDILGKSIFWWKIFWLAIFKSKSQYWITSHQMPRWCNTFSIIPHLGIFFNFVTFMSYKPHSYKEKESNLVQGDQR